MSTIIFYAQFKSAATTLGVNVTATIEIEKLHRATKVKSGEVAAGTATTYGNGGLRYFILDNADLATYDYFGTMVTSDTTVIDRQPPTMWSDFGAPATARLPIALVDGKMNSHVASMGNDVLTGAATHISFTEEITAGSPSTDTVATAVAAKVLVTPANKIKTNASNQVEASSVQGNVTGSVASVTNDVGITQGGADKVWVSSVRSLTTLTSLLNDIAAAIWSSATRTLTGGGTTGPTADEIAAKILVTPANKIKTNVANQVEASSVAGDVNVGSFTNSAIGLIWNALLSGLTLPGSIGKLIADNLNASVGSRATKADVQVTVESGEINALTPQQEAKIDAITEAIAALQAVATAIANQTDGVETPLGQVKSVTDKLSAMIEGDGGDYRFDAKALELAPTGSGGGFTADEKALLLADKVLTEERTDDGILLRDGNVPKFNRIVTTNGSKATVGPMEVAD